MKPSFPTLQMTDPTTLKQALYNHCQAYVDERLARIRKAIKVAQDAANEESKSSMGDKYETTRAMMHLEKEKLSGQLQEAEQLNRALTQINHQPTANVQLGSLVEASTGIFYIAVSVGKVVLAGKTYFVVSPASPIGKALFGKAAGEEINFNGRKIILKAVY